MSKVTSKLPTVGRVFLGLVFFVFGLNGFLHFLPQPPIPAGAASLLGAMIGSGYLLAFVKATEVLVGALLLANRFVPLALTILAPIVLNIVAVHTFLAPEGLPVAVVVLALEIYLAWTYRAVFAPMLHAKNEPAVAASSEQAPAGARVAHT